MQRLTRTLSMVLCGVALAQPSTRPTSRATSRPAPPKPPVSLDAAGKLAYAAAANGDRVPDFSFAGFEAGERPIPFVPAKLRVVAVPGDNTATIQAAIDQLAATPLPPGGFRGAVLLPPGKIEVAGTLVLRADGIVLRGSGPGDTGTTLLATGPDRRTVIRVDGEPSRVAAESGPVTTYVPVGTNRLHTPLKLIPGAHVIIRRQSTPAWIASLGMQDLGGDRHGPSWRPGSRDVAFYRVVKAVDGDAVTLDVPLTIGLGSPEAPATIELAQATGRTLRVGVENLRIESVTNGSAKDEDHAWFGVGIDHAEDVWVRRVECGKLAGSAVAVWDDARRVTVEDCKNLEPVGEVGGWRRYAFFTTGQQVLMQRLVSHGGFHDFAVGFATPGPVAFVQCEATDSHGDSGAIDSAASGILFDRVRIDRQPLSLRNRAYLSQGAGWSAFNCMLWNSTAPLIECWRPPGAQNWAMGTQGEFAGDGAFSGSNDDLNPDSLYYAQLAERIGRSAAEERAKLNLPPVQGTRAPTLASAAEAIAVTMKPRVTMSDWIDELARREPIDVSPDGVAVADAPREIKPSPVPAKQLSIRNGWLVVGDELATGQIMPALWWGGSLRRGGGNERAQPVLTRFVPGREGRGLTDDLSEVVEEMARRGQVAAWQHPPLWYERRRDDHTRVQRMDGEVVAPFYETPWARSGEGTASDGLSKWDVTRPNPWYYGRLRAFADLANARGLVLFNGLYMQHSVLEAGAHYADFPWRPVNNVNPVGLPEPVFFAGDKLIYIAEKFYDLSDPKRRELHRRYMRTQLDQLASKPNVIFFLSEEYTGPLEFVEFWLDTVAEWKAETGKSPLIALYATQDVTDAILADEKRAAVVSLIFSKFNTDGDTGWWTQPDGKSYSPEGGKNLSPRQWYRLLKPKPASEQNVYAMVRQYREKYPDKPFIYDGPDEFRWAALFGGASMTGVKLPAELRQGLCEMKPVGDLAGDHELAGPAGSLRFLRPGSNFLFDDDRRKRVREIDPITGDVIQDAIVEANHPATPSAGKGPSVLWITDAENK